MPHTTGAWSTAAIVEIDGAHAGARVARRIAELVPALHAGLGAFTDGDVAAGLELHVAPLGPRLGTFALLGHSLTGEGFSYGGGVNVRVIGRAWLPGARVAGDSERGMLVGLSTRFWRQCPTETPRIAARVQFSAPWAGAPTLPIGRRPPCADRP